LFSLAISLSAGAMAPSALAQSDPLAQPPGGVDFRTLNYGETGFNASGRAICCVRPGTSARAALNAAIPDVAKILGVKPTLTSGFVDNKSNHGGGVNFTATVSGTPVKGSILAGVGPDGVMVCIIYAVANCPASDWSALLADLPSSIKLTTTSFGDGVGTIGLPHGWTIAQSNNMGTVIVAGPEEEQVAIMVTMVVLAPGSPEAISQQRAAQLARQFGQQPADGYAIAPYASGADALREICPYLSQTSVSHGGPSQKIKQIIGTKSLPPDPAHPDYESSFVQYLSNIGKPGGTVVRQAIAQTTTNHLAPLHGGWGLCISAVSAPDNIFAREMPTLIAIWHSYNPDVQKALANGQANTIAMQNALNQVQANMQASQDQTEQIISDMNQRQLAANRSFDDEDEIIRGYRTVEDTQTGKQADVNLEDAHAIVDALNEGDPGRYIQIPLRDQVDPF
jgi:hypothetical protein